MATLADSLVSSSARRLNIRVRPDLSARRQRYQGRSYWVVKDPVGLQYYRFQDEEYFILNLLDGDISLDEIKERFEAEFPPQKITLDEIQSFLGMLHQSNLILVQVQGQGEQLLKRRVKKRRRELIGAFSNILAIRFKGIDPERLLNRMLPWTRWFFSLPMLCFATLLAASALLLITVQFAEFQAKLPGFYQFFSPTNALLMAAMLGLTKVFHEFGHGLSCKRFGGECHEMGVMFLVLTPCLYCNVSDSWMLPNKWHRMAIGAAGMYVEVIIASICTFLWWFSTPGLFQNLCLNVMFVSGVSTILFNANPLLRYDGYYILADFVEIPNLRQKATQVLGRESGRIFLGLKPPDDPFMPQRNKLFFALFTVASGIYRWIITFSILWFLYRLSKPYKLEIIAYIIGSMSLFSLLVMPLWKIGKFLYTPGRLDRVKKPRLYLSLAGLAGLLYLFFYLPLPMKILAPFEIQARNPESIYIQTPGRLVECYVRPGEYVTAGQVLARLENPDLALQVAKLEGEISQLEAKVKSLKMKQSVSVGSEDTRIDKTSEDLYTNEGLLVSKKSELRQQQMEYSRLVLKASRSGKVFPPPSAKRKNAPETPLPTWEKTPLDAYNIGAWLEEQKLFCQIADPHEMKAVLIIDQEDAKFARVPRAGDSLAKQKVRLKLDELPDEVLEGTLDSLSVSPLTQAPKHLSASAKGNLPTKQDEETGILRPQNTSYEAHVYLDDERGVLRLGLRGMAKVYMDRDQWHSAAWMLWRMLNNTFNFKM